MSKASIKALPVGEITVRVERKDAAYLLWGDEYPLLLDQLEQKRAQVAQLQRQLEAARRDALMEAGAKCRELGSLSDPDMGEREGLMKAARYIEGLVKTGAGEDGR